MDCCESVAATTWAMGTDLSVRCSTSQQCTLVLKDMTVVDEWARLEVASVCEWVPFLKQSNNCCL